MSMPQQKPGRSRQDYATPPELIAAVKVKLGIAEFDIDLAADDDGGNSVVPDGYYYSLGNDALTMPWFIAGGWNWLNPPFDSCGRFAQKAAEEWTNHDARTAMLVPASVGTNWWRDWVHGHARVLLLNGRLTFVGCTDPYPKDCALVLYGCTPSYEVWSWNEPKSRSTRLFSGSQQTRPSRLRNRSDGDNLSQGSRGSADRGGNGAARRVDEGSADDGDVGNSEGIRSECVLVDSGTDRA